MVIRRCDFKSAYNYNKKNNYTQCYNDEIRISSMLRKKNQFFILCYGDKVSYNEHGAKKVLKILLKNL